MEDREGFFARRDEIARLRIGGARDGGARAGGFLGCGWSFPPTFSRGDHSVVLVCDNRDIQQSLWVLFSTSIGERIMVPEYGSRIWQMVFQAINTTLINRLREMVRQAILNWEPRIDVDEISVEPDASEVGLVRITVFYTIRTTNTRSNLVYPFYLLEGTIAPLAP